MIPTSIVVHCAETPAGGWYTAADIERWHKARGWNGIGYHAIVLLDGVIQAGRQEDQQGAYVLGHSPNSLAICYIGGMAKDGKTPQDTRTEPQRISLFEQVADWMSRYEISPDRIFGHYELDNRKACPSFDMEQFRSELSGIMTQAPTEGSQQINTLAQLPQIGGSYTGHSIQRLQGILGVTQDGWIGLETYQAIHDLVVDSQRSKN